MRILVVEDEKKVARALREGLEAEYYDVTVAHTGEEGFYELNAQTFDLIILDLMLPGRGGLEILKTARERGVTAPVLILVGSLMISHAGEIDWNEPVVAIPAFLTMITIPLTFSIANGLAFGFTVHTLLRVLRGEARRVPWLVYAMTALFLARFFLLGNA